VEADKTKNPETLAAIAAAFDLEVRDLGWKFRIPESKPAKAVLLESVDDFRSAIHRAHDMFTIQRLTEGTKRVDELLTSMFQDLDCISPDEFDIFESFLQTLHEPLEELHSLGFGIFSIQETRDVFVKSGSPNAQTLPWENCTHAHFILIPRHGCFRMGGPSSNEMLHRFNPDCSVAVNEVLRMFQKELQVGIFRNVIYAMGALHSIRWCDSCFPVHSDGSRISLDYLSAITAMPKTDLVRQFKEMRSFFADVS
jgi:hypothetical protein